MMGARIFPSKRESGRAAAAWAAARLRNALDRQPRARIIVGTGPSQSDMIDALVTTPGIDWSRLEVFHMDEYEGIAATHPASFRLWLRTHVAGRVGAGTFHYLAGDTPDVEAECRRYAALLAAAPIDLCFAGFGENGHIAFNDPHEADFADPLLVRPVTLDERCRQQQVGEGHFPEIDAVPKRALTLTCPALMSARHLLCTAPDRRKAEAVRDALTGPVTTRCPASLVQTHPDAAVFLDADSASLLPPGYASRGPAI